MPSPLLSNPPSFRFGDMVKSGQVFFASNTAIEALSVNSAIATGFILSNPLSSGNDLRILLATIATASAPIAQANYIWTGNALNTAEAETIHTTPLVVQNAYISGPVPTGVGLADSAATVPTPTVLRSIGGGPVAPGMVTSPLINDEVDEMMILAPGTVVSIQAMTTSISAVITVYWRVLPA